MIPGMVAPPSGHATGIGGATTQVAGEKGTLAMSRRPQILLGSASWTVLDRVWIYGAAVLGGLLLGLFVGGANGAAVGGVGSVAVSAWHALRSRPSDR